ncbi:MAG: hypothetical protein EZS28_051690 [Streblomastix strix]|uniref:Uncharacterized protein n=1 Tax=Streblomastix strix TaxID=222440 RepID=A0A5J4T379_9EUKA|nr:MAG: hypothetical protein EZS28_051690 [Streblomastix strix]
MGKDSVPKCTAVMVGLQSSSRLTEPVGTVVICQMGQTGPIVKFQRIQSAINMGKLSVMRQFPPELENSVIQVQLDLPRQGLLVKHQVFYLAFLLKSQLVLGRVWQWSVPVTGMSDAQFATILVCFVCAIVASSVFRRNSGVQLAVPRASVQRAKVQRSPKCQSHANKLSASTKVSLG